MLNDLILNINTIEKNNDDNNIDFEFNEETPVNLGSIENENTNEIEAF